MLKLPDSALTNLLSLYRMSFGLPVPPRVVKTESPGQIASQIAIALEGNAPVAEWHEPSAAQTDSTAERFQKTSLENETP